MSNPRRWVLVRRAIEFTGYSEIATRHEAKNGACVGRCITVFDASGSREPRQQGGAA